jgi:hypothetical protein
VTVTAPDHGTAERRVPAPVGARRLAAGLRQRARRTPDRLTALTVALVLLTAGTGLVAALSVRGRDAALAEASGRSSRLSLAALAVYQSLSDADATAAGSFLAAGAEPPEAGQRYGADLARAAAALSTVAAGAAAGGEVSTAVAELAGDLPVYAGRIDAARAYNRQSLPLGAAYLREASTLLRERMLPAAQRLYGSAAARLDQARGRGGALPWRALLLGVLTLAALVATQAYLTRATNRMLNLGLLAATAGTLAAVVWLAVAAAQARSATDTARRDGTAQVQALAQARIAGLQARSAEALTLVARGNGADQERQFTDLVGQLGGGQLGGGLLDEARQRIRQPDSRAEVDAAAAALGSWRQTHQALRQLDDAGQYMDAVALATGPASTSSGSLASAVDDHLGRAIDQASARFDQAAARARSALSGVAAGVAALLVLAAAASAAGMWPRIAEYR